MITADMLYACSLTHMHGISEDAHMEAVLRLAYETMISWKFASM